MFSAFSQFPSNTQPAEFTQQMDSMFAVMRMGTTIVTLAIAVLLAWLVKRLVSLPVRHEFGAL
jgi:flagellar biogenesis protein FliO